MEHRLDVKALALICTEVEPLQRFNKADFCLLMRTDWFVVSHRVSTLSLFLHVYTKKTNEKREDKKLTSKELLKGRTRQVGFTL